EAAAEPGNFGFLYPSDAPLCEKIETVAAKMYGADGVDYTPLAARQLDGYERNGFGGLPVCIAKTHLSLSHDPTLKGAPTGWRTGRRPRLAGRRPRWSWPRRPRCAPSAPGSRRAS